ncbi:MAG: capsule assembly Wzi family protein, partial [Balneolaceae bacterium]
IHNSLQFGYNAPGFLHLRLGTFKPWETAIGNVEIAYIFGGVRKSDYYDENVYDTHSINSLMLSYSPKFGPGLSVGAIRTFFHRYPSDFGEYRDQVSKIFEAAVRVGLQSEDNPSGHDPDNQVASVFARWVFPASGFEFYAEYGRNDHNVDLRDLRAQPDHHRAYLMGMLKSIHLPKNRLLAVGVEIMQSETPRASLTRGNANLGGWYTHAQQVVGFTNRGQIMGTAYGPGANVQMLTADLYDPKGRLGLTFARITYHNSRLDQFFPQIQAANVRSVERWEVRNVELMAGIRATLFARHGIEIETAIEQSIIFNENNLVGNDLGNTRFELVLRKQINGWLR